MKEFKQIIFWGAAWGVLEATLGWGLHLIHFKGEALVLYPFGLACMLAAARQCKGPMAKTVLNVALVAAVIKLVNLFTWVGVPAYYVINPAIAIFLEGMVTFVFCSIIEREHNKIRSPLAQIPLALLLVFASFLIFKGWQVGMDSLTAFNPDAHIGMSIGMIIGWLWKAGIQAIMLVLAVKIAYNYTPNERWQMQTTRFALPIFIIAILATYWL